MLSYDSSKIGKLIAIGAEHVVYSYDNDKVIKFPRGIWYWLNRSKFVDNMRRNQEVIKTRFREYLIDRDAIFYDNSYVIIEPFIVGRRVRRSDLSNCDIKNQFREIILINDKMMRDDNISLEFFGLWGLLFKGREEVANIMLEEKTGRLIIIDPGALHFGVHRDRSILSRTIIKYVLFQQRHLLNGYMHS